MSALDSWAHECHTVPPFSLIAVLSSQTPTGNWNYLRRVQIQLLLTLKNRAERAGPWQAVTQHSCCTPCLARMIFKIWHISEQQLEAKNRSSELFILEDKTPQNVCYLEIFQNWLSNPDFPLSVSVPRFALAGATQTESLNWMGMLELYIYKSVHR